MDTPEEVRRRAANYFKKDKARDPNAALMNERKKIEAALDAKTARLKSLRLAKEAAERDAAPRRVVAKRNVARA